MLSPEEIGTDTVVVVNVVSVVGIAIRIDVKDVRVAVVEVVRGQATVEYYSISLPKYLIILRIIFKSTKKGFRGHIQILDNSSLS